MVSKRGTAVVKKQPKYIDVWDADRDLSPRAPAPSSARRSGKHSSPATHCASKPGPATTGQSLDSPSTVRDQIKEDRFSSSSLPPFRVHDTPPGDDRSPTKLDPARRSSNPLYKDTSSPARSPTHEPPPASTRKPSKTKRSTTKQLSPSLPAREPSPTTPGLAAAMAHIPPSQMRYMRACMVCSIVRTEQQFRTSGCPNCESFLELAGNSDAVQECTSSVWDGLLTVSDTSRSWVARHQRLEGYVPGVYAVQVEGILPDDIIVAAENAGVQYIPRDGSVDETLPTE